MGRERERDEEWGKRREAPRVVPVPISVASAVPRRGGRRETRGFPSKDPRAFLWCSRMQQANGNGAPPASPRKKQRVSTMGGGPISKVTVVLGAQWGDEGKGKVVDMLAMDADVVCRCQVCVSPGNLARTKCHLALFFG